MTRIPAHPHAAGAGGSPAPQAAVRAPVGQVSTSAMPFKGALERARSETVTVRRGDTLTAIVKEQWARQGGAATELGSGQAHRWALQVARANGLTDADRIQPGQRLMVPGPEDRIAHPAPPRVALQAPARLPQPVVRRQAEELRAAAPAWLNATSGTANPLMQQTLQRAVQRGFIAAADVERVEQRIAELADKHGFRPDDFARTVLMESDGLNPRATNGRCHGIIQFCAGPDRGAASAGYGQRPEAILQLGVLQQLDLVDRYFDDTRLRDFRGADGSVRLDDLYLTILTPAARQERRMAAPLPIAGPQALDLHVGRDRQNPITRTSILGGLHAHARDRLGSWSLSPPMMR